LSKNPLFFDVVSKLFLFGGVSILILFLINLKWKISAHTYSCASIAGMILCLVYHFDDWQNFMILIVSILVLGMVASARLYLKAHQNHEVILGFAFGFLLGGLAPQWLFLS
jgi:membrane-associated phospholipid phosphatase